jgi:hypothetical protein
MPRPVALVLWRSQVPLEDAVEKGCQMVGMSHVFVKQLDHSIGRLRKRELSSGESNEHG